MTADDQEGLVATYQERRALYAAFAERLAVVLEDIAKPIVGLAVVEWRAKEVASLGEKIGSVSTTMSSVSSPMTQTRASSRSASRVVYMTMLLEYFAMGRATMIR